MKKVKEVKETRLVGPEVEEEALYVPHSLLTKSYHLMSLSGRDDQLHSSSLQEIGLSSLQHLAKSGRKAF